MTADVLRAASAQLSRWRMQLRRRWDALRFPARSRASLLRLRELGRPRRILVVCHGNICRSPYLESALRARLHEVDVLSAGFVGPDRTVPSEGLEVAGRRGLDLRPHRSRLVSAALLRDVDLVIVMDPVQARALAQRHGVDPRRIVLAGDLHCANGDLRVVRDPWQQPIEVFEQTYDRLDQCASVLTNWIANAPTRPARLPRS
jgi:protein-tyrosine phosphatase